MVVMVFVFLRSLDVMIVVIEKENLGCWRTHIYTFFTSVQYTNRVTSTYRRELCFRYRYPFLDVHCLRHASQ